MYERLIRYKTLCSKCQLLQPCQWFGATFPEMLGRAAGLLVTFVCVPYLLYLVKGVALAIGTYHVQNNISILVYC